MEVNLVLFKPDGRRKDIPISAATTIIGRGEECSLRVPLVSVSRHHCELSINDDSLKVKDLDSSNGTYVNGEKIDEETELSAGDRLVIGPVIFTVQIDGSPEEIAAAEAQSQEVDFSDSEILAVASSDDGDLDGDEDAIFSVLEDSQVDGEVGDVDPLEALEALAMQDEEEKEQT